MTFPDPSVIESVKGVLTKHPGGLTISGLAEKTRLNRNRIAKYLDYLLLSGQLEMKHFGSSKVYSLASRLPVSALFFQVFDPVLMLNENHCIIRVNDPFLAVLKEEQEKIVGRKLSDLPYSVLINTIQKTLLENNPANPVQTPGIALSIQGNPCHYSIKTIPVVLDNGKSGTAVFLRDITAEKDLQVIRELEQSRQEALTEDLSEFVVQFRPDGTIRSMNPAASRFFLRSLGELPEITIRSVVLLEDQIHLFQVLKNITRENPVANCFCRIIDPVGKIHQISWSIRGLFDPSGMVQEYLGIGSDITELSAARQTIDRLNADQWLLTKMACELIDLPRDADIYEILGRAVKEILPGAIVVVNEFNPDLSFVTTRCFLGDREREIFSKIIGRDVVGMEFGPPDGFEKSHVIQNLKGGKIVKVPGNVEVMMMGQIPRAMCETIEKDLNIGDMYVIGLSMRDYLFGNVCLFLQKGDLLQHHEILEIFLHHAVQALKSRHLEEATKELEISWKTGNLVNSR